MKRVAHPRGAASAGVAFALVVSTVLVASCGAGGGNRTGSTGSGGAANGGDSSGGAANGGSSTGGSSGGGAANGGNSSGGTGSAGFASSTGGATTTDQSKASACIVYVTAECERIEACSGQSNAGCVAQTLGCPDIVFSDGADRTAAGMFACASDWTTFPCDQVQGGYTPPCTTPGTRASGAPCTIPAQCQSLSCDTPSPCGTCGTIAAPGGNCIGNYDCPGGYYCTTGTCQPAPIRFAQPGDACSNSNGPTCVPDYACTDSPSEPGVVKCRPLPSEGEPCPTDACTSTSFCNAQQMCQALPHAGEPCGTTGAASTCAADSTCNATTHACAAKPGVGQPCGTSDACAPPLACVCTQSGFATVASGNCSAACATLRNPGESCDAPGSACVASKCENGTCVAIDSQGTFDAACNP